MLGKARRGERRLQPEDGAQPTGEQERREAGAHLDPHVLLAPQLAEGKPRPREEDDLINIRLTITTAAGAKSWVGREAKGGWKDEQVGRHIHTKEPYFGGHPFHFTRYSTLPWEEREADTVRYAAALTTTHRTVRPNTFCRLVLPRDIHNPGTLPPWLCTRSPPTQRHPNFGCCMTTPDCPSWESTGGHLASNISGAPVAEAQSPCHTWGN